MKTLLIKNASHILTMDDKENELTNSSIFCRSGVIEWVGDYKNLKEKAKQLSNFDIPKMMQEMNVTKLKLKDGASIEVKPFYGAHIPANKQEEAFNWLRENGLGDIIKNDVTVTFGRGEDNKAMAYATLAKGQGYEPVQKIGVHSQTLKAVVRERIESGQDMPADLFKTFVGNQTKIIRRN